MPKFVDANTIKRAGYTSRKDMELAVHRRAKVQLCGSLSFGIWVLVTGLPQYIFDSDPEKDKVKVVQSALLLAFFYTDTQDRATAWRAWQWTGTAITLPDYRSPLQPRGYHRKKSLPARSNTTVSSNLVELLRTTRIPISLYALTRTKVKAAVAQINVTLERLVDLDEGKWLKPLS